MTTVKPHNTMYGEIFPADKGIKTVTFRDTMGGLIQSLHDSNLDNGESRLDAKNMHIGGVLLGKKAEKGLVRGEGVNKRKTGEGEKKLTCDSVPPSSSLSTPAPGAGLVTAIFLRFARFSSRFCFRISTCCSSRRRLNSSGLKVAFALKLRLCSGIYRSAMFDGYFFGERLLSLLLDEGFVLVDRGEVGWWGERKMRGVEVRREWISSDNPAAGGKGL